MAEMTVLEGISSVDDFTQVFKILADKLQVWPHQIF